MPQFADIPVWTPDDEDIPPPPGYSFDVWTPDDEKLGIPAPPGYRSREEQGLLPDEVFQEAEAGLRKRGVIRPQETVDQYESRTKPTLAEVERMDREAEVAEGFQNAAYTFSKEFPKDGPRNEEDYARFATRAMEMAGLDSSKLNMPVVREKFKPALDAFDAARSGVARDVPEAMRPAVLEAAQYLFQREAGESQPGWTTRTVTKARTELRAMGIRRGKSESEAEFSDVLFRARNEPYAASPPGEGFWSRFTSDILGSLAPGVAGAPLGGLVGMGWAYGKPHGEEVVKLAKERGAPDWAAGLGGGAVMVADAVLFGGVRNELVAQVGGKEALGKWTKQWFADLALKSAETGVKLSLSQIQGQFFKDMAVWAGGRWDPKAVEEMKATLDRSPENFLAAAVLHGGAEAISLSRTDAGKLRMPEKAAQTAQGREKWLQENQARLWAKVPTEAPQWAKEADRAEVDQRAEVDTEAAPPVETRLPGDRLRGAGDRGGEEVAGQVPPQEENVGRPAGRPADVTEVPPGAQQAVHPKTGTPAVHVGEQFSMVIDPGYDKTPSTVEITTEPWIEFGGETKRPHQVFTVKVLDGPFSGRHTQASEWDITRPSPEPQPPALAKTAETSPLESGPAVPGTPQGTFFRNEYPPKPGETVRNVFVDDQFRGQTVTRESPESRKQLDRDFPNEAKPEEPVYQFFGIHLDEAFRGKGIGGQMILDALSQRPNERGAWYYNGQLERPAALAFGRLVKQGLVEMRWKKTTTRTGKTYITEAPPGRYDFDTTFPDLGPFMARLTPKGWEAAGRGVAEAGPKPVLKPREKRSPIISQAKRIAEAAEKHGLPPDRLKIAAEEIWAAERAKFDAWEPIQKLLREAKVDPRRGKLAELDETAVKGLDTLATEIVRERPEILQPGESALEAVWRVLKEETLKKPTIADVLPKAVERVQGEIRSETVPSEPIKVETEPSKAAAARADFVNGLQELRTIAFSGVDIPKMFKVVADSIRAGVLTAEEFLNHAFEQLKDEFDKFGPSLAKVWNEHVAKDKRLTPVTENDLIWYGWDEKTLAEIAKPLEGKKPEAPFEAAKPAAPPEAEPEFKLGEEPPEPMPASTEGGPRAYSVKNAAMAATTGRPEPPVRPERRWTMEGQAAKAKAAEPAETDALIDRMRSDPDYLASSDDNAKLHARIVSLGERLLRESDPAKKQAIDAEMVEMQQLSRRTGTEQSAALGSRRLTTDEQYEVGNQIAEWREAKGEPLTGAEEAEVRKGVEGIEKAKREAAMERAGPALDEITKEGKAEAKPSTKIYSPAIRAFLDRAEKWIDRLAEPAEQWMDETRQSGKTLADLWRDVGGELDPERAAKIVRNLAALGVKKFGHLLIDAARWADAMAAEYGPLPDKLRDLAYTEANRIVDETLASGAKKAGLPKPLQEKAVKVVKDRIEKKAEGSEAITEKVRKRVDKDGLITHAAVHKLAKALVAEGVGDRNKLVDALHGTLSAIKPELKLADTIDLLAGPSRKLLAQDRVSVTLRGIVGEVQKVSKLYSMLVEGTAGRLFGVQGSEPTDMGRWFQQKVNEAKKLGGFKTTDPVKQAKSIFQSMKTRLGNQIKDLRKEIADREPIVKDKGSKPTFTPEQEVELQQLRGVLEEVQKLHDEVPEFKAAKNVKEEARKINALQNRLEKLDQKLAEGDFSPKKRLYKNVSPKEREVVYEIEERKGRLLAGKEEFRRNKNLGTKALAVASDVHDLSFAVMTGGEMSYVLRQGKFYLYTMPEKAFPAIGKSVLAMFSRKAEFAEHVKLAERDNARNGEYKYGGLETTASHGPQAAKEELFRSRILDWMASRRGVLGIPFRLPAEVFLASGRGFRTFANIMRADFYDAIKAEVSKGRTWDPDVDAKAAANAANVFGGRARMNEGRGLLRFFFAPRWLKAQAQFLIGQPIWSAPEGMKGAVAKMYVRWAVTAIGVAIAKDLIYRLTAEDDEHKPKYEWDFRSADFLKRRMGATRMDETGGLGSLLTLGARIVTGQTKTATGEIKSLRGEDRPYGGRDVWDVFTDFGRQKLAPGSSGVVDWLSGENVVGDPVGIAKILGERFSPIAWRDVADAEKELGVVQGTVAAADAIFGTGLNTYKPRKKSRKRPVLKSAPSSR